MAEAVAQADSPSPVDHFADNSDLPSFTPAPVYNGAVKGPGGKFVSAKAKAIEEAVAAQVQSEPQVNAEPIAEIPDEPAAQPAQPVQIQHSPVLIQAARQLGFPEQYIAGTPSAQLLEDVKLQSHLNANQPTPVAPVAPPAPEPIDWGVNSATGEKWTEKEYSDSYGPAVVRAVKAAHEADQTKKELAALRNEIQQERRSQNEQRAMGEVNAFFAKHKDIYGDKPVGQTDPFSPHGLKQQSILRNIEALLASKQATTPTADCERIHQGIFGVITPASVASGYVNRITEQQWAAGGLVNPTQRQAQQPELSRRERMIREEAAKFRENGVHVAAAGQDDNSDLPKAN